MEPNFIYWIHKGQSLDPVINHFNPDYEFPKRYVL